MKSVKLPREIAEALEYAKKVHLSLINILDDVFNCGGRGDGKMELLAEYFNGDEVGLMRALVNGYEVEEKSTPPEECLRAYYNYLLCCQKKHAHKGEYTKADARLDGFLTALELLDIKIEGINV